MSNLVALESMRILDITFSMWAQPYWKPHFSPSQNYLKFWTYLFFYLQSCCFMFSKEWPQINFGVVVQFFVLSLLSDFLYSGDQKFEWAILSARNQWQDLTKLYVLTSTVIIKSLLSGALYGDCRHSVCYSFHVASILSEQDCLLVSLGLRFSLSHSNIFLCEQWSVDSALPSCYVSLHAISPLSSIAKFHGLALTAVNLKTHWNKLACILFCIAFELSLRGSICLRYLS